ncbi:MAG: NADH-ubiquinone oxidoreductase-F iron-sulfur binding region domain-containing protein [Dehalococcoidia bacterium]|jgi:NADH-quinone oxidoreductase subunit F|nr:NADH-ubiquinone oxidoreductase-F iron-sulfur binding region domain-containing protein [Dehalococcoidia bacterium]
MNLQETYALLRKRATGQWQSLEESPHPRILLGAATCGRAAGGKALMGCIHQELSDLGIQATVISVGCLGLCYTEPLVDIIKPGLPRITYHVPTPEVLHGLLSDYLVHDNPRPDLALGSWGEEIAGIPRFWELPMLKPQVRVVLKNCGNIDPEDINHYLANDGYQGLARALSMTPEEVIAEVEKSGIRGRGGAGFPAAQKWKFCRASPGTEKYLVCNFDEGDPGAFMNRALVEGDPHALVEGMLIAGYAIGATHGFIYGRAEYPLALERLRKALNDAQRDNLLGENILGSGHSFDISIREGAGAFVCGEETSLLASIEGKRGMPRPRPPFPAVKGVFGKPTTINNVETLGTLAHILRNGGEWYHQYGTEQSPGTKTYSLVGKVKRTGLIEMPLGATLQQAIVEIGGGLMGGKNFKAAQTGGPSGGSLPVSALDLTIDYDALTAAGSIMGSGGLIIMDEDTCLVDLARYFLTFTTRESCGKCVPCRVGTRQMLDMLERIAGGQATPENLEQLESLAQTVKSTALCGLGQTAPNPVLTTIRYFREEYEEHINKHLCRAAVCKGLVVAPCHHLCPAGVQAYRYVRLCKEGRFAEALAVNRETIPFPAVLGRVCTHFCETRCTRGKVDEPIAIRALKRIASENDDGAWRERERHDPPTGKQVAVVGSGPAGLTCAMYLAKKGHSVTVFESLPQAGGMLRVGIPAYRLPRDVLDQEIAEVERVGVTIRTNAPVNSLEELRGQGFEAIFLAVGAHRGQRTGADGEEGVVTEAVTLLRQVALGKEVSVGQRVAVIGGGNAAIDAARTALRLGASEVTILYRRTRQEMPALEEEVDEAEGEGVGLVLLVAPTKMWREDGAIKLELQRMKLGDMDASGRRRPVPVEGSEFVRDFDTVVAAVGQAVQLPSGIDIPTAGGNTLSVEEDTLATPVSGVFAGGDCVTGPATVIESIDQGRRAATAIDRYLGGDGDISEVLLDPEAGAEAMVPVDEGERPRVPIPMVEGAHHNGFTACELGYSSEMALDESQRCLNCDLERGD